MISYKVKVKLELIGIILLLFGSIVSLIHFKLNEDRVREANKNIIVDGKVCEFFIVVDGYSSHGDEYSHREVHCPQEIK
jgi:hypothetical protein